MNAATVHPDEHETCAANTLHNSRAHQAEEASPTGHAPRTERQAINYCPYCSEEDLFPLEGGGWECRSCRRAFSVTFKGLVAPGRRGDPQ